MQTKTIAADFSTRDVYPKIEEGLAGLEIGVLGKAGVVLDTCFLNDWLLIVLEYD